MRDESNATIELEREGHVRFMPVEAKRCGMPPMWRTYQRIVFREDYACIGFFDKASLILLCQFKVNWGYEQEMSNAPSSQ